MELIGEARIGSRAGTGRGFRRPGSVAFDRVACRVVEPQDGARRDRRVIDQGDELVQARKLGPLAGEPDLRVALADGGGLVCGRDRFLDDGNPALRGLVQRGQRS